MALSIFCPVKVFAYLVSNKRVNSLATIVGSVVAATGIPGSVILLNLGHTDFAKPVFILGVVGTAAAILGVENARIQAEKIYAEKIAERNRVIESNPPNEDNIIEAAKYLTTYYWMFWEEKIHHESEINREHLVRPNFPSEFGYAFGYALLKALEMKINARYEKICEREGDAHPPRWEIEFRQEMSGLELKEKDLYSDVKTVIETFLKGPKAFNKEVEDKNKYRPLLYCELVKLLQKYHNMYTEVLLKIRANKKARISKQMAAPTVKLPVIPVTFSEPASDVASGISKPTSSDWVAIPEEGATKKRKLTVAELFTPTSNEPVSVSKYEHLALSNEPAVDRRAEWFKLPDPQPHNQANKNVKPDGGADARTDGTTG